MLRNTLASRPDPNETRTQRFERSVHRRGSKLALRNRHFEVSDPNGPVIVVVNTCKSDGRQLEVSGKQTTMR
jgi:hypothetical protein